MFLAGCHAELELKLPDKQKAPHAALCCLRVLAMLI
jgi:hypothetical protein